MEDTNSQRVRSILMPIFALLLTSLTSCASKPSMKVERESIEKNSESFAILSDRVKDQDDKLERLTISINDLSRQLAKAERQIARSREEKLASVTRNGTVPLQKLRPTDEADEVAEVLKAVGGEDGEAIADSSQETIHWYYDGVRQVRDAKYDEAIRSFRKFLEESPEHVYADRSEYWIAESYFRNKEYQLSILSANGMEAHHPYSLRLPDALLLKAHSFRAMGQRDDAREALRQVVTRFPTSRLADSASKELAQMSLESASPARAPVLIDDQIQ